MQDILLITDPSPITVSQFNLVESLDNAKDMWYRIARAELKLHSNLISFIDSCGFTCKELQSIAREIEELKWRDFEESESSIDMFDRSEAQNGQY